MKIMIAGAVEVQVLKVMVVLKEEIVSNVRLVKIFCQDIRTELLQRG